MVDQPLKRTVLSSSFQWCRLKNYILKISYRVTKIVNHLTFLAHPAYWKEKRLFYGVGLKS